MTLLAKKNTLRLLTILGLLFLNQSITAQSAQKKEKIIVGVNQFIQKEESKIPILKIDESIRSKQTERLNQLKAKRNNQQCATCLEQIKKNALEGSNLMPAVIAAVENYCTLGEIADTLRKVFGEHQ